MRVTPQWQKHHRDVARAVGVLRTLVDKLTVRGALVSEELLLMMKPQEKTPATSAPRPGAVPQPAVRKAPAPAPVVRARRPIKPL